MKDDLKALAAKEVELLHGHIANITIRRPNQNAEALAEWRQAMKGLAPKEKQEFVEVVDTMLSAKGNPGDPHLVRVDLNRNEFIVRYDNLGPGGKTYIGYNTDGDQVFFAQLGGGVFAVTNPTENPQYDPKKMHFYSGKTISQILDQR